MRSYARNMSSYADEVEAPAYRRPAPTLIGADREAAQLEQLRAEFSRLRPVVSSLDRLARDRGLDAIETLSNVVPILFPTAIYRSYPGRWLAQEDVGHLSRWLAQLSSATIPSIAGPTSGNLEEWICELDDTSELRIGYYQDVPGKPGFIPRTLGEWQARARAVYGMLSIQGANEECSRVTVRLAHEFGESVALRTAAALEESGSRTWAEYLYPGQRASLRTILSEAGDQEAMARPNVVSLRPGMGESGNDRGRSLCDFLRGVATRVGKRNVCLAATWSDLRELAGRAVREGLRGLFNSDSVVWIPDAAHERPPSPQERAQIEECLGIERYIEFYAAPQLVSVCRRCTQGNYHIPATLIAFVLESDSGEPFPREGTHTGRLAFFDLLVRASWGGVLTDDVATLTASPECCGCGAPGMYLGGTLSSALDLRATDAVECGAQDARRPLRRGW
jgi:hypothetical protein